MRFRQSASFALAVVALATAGCGSGSGAAGSSEAFAGAGVPARSPAGRRFAADTAVICQRLNAELKASKSATQSVHEIERLALPHAKLELVALKELSALKPPATLAADWRHLVLFRRSLAEQLVDLAKYARADDAVAIRALGVEKARVHRELRTLGERDGWEACSIVG